MSSLATKMATKMAEKQLKDGLKDVAPKPPAGSGPRRRSEEVVASISELASYTLAVVHTYSTEHGWSASNKAG